MKKFDYVKSRISEFWVILTQNVVIFSHLELWDEPIKHTLQQSASVGYVEIMTLDKNGHLETRDRCVLVGDGSLQLIFPGKARVNWDRVSVYHLAAQYHENKDSWSISKREPRHHTIHR